MSRVILPYNLQDGQKAYAAKLMANLNALAAKLNSVSLPGLADSDMETALQQLKLLLDDEYAADAKVLQSFSFDEETAMLTITLENGAVFSVDMNPLIPDISGTEGAELAVSVGVDGAISAALKDGAIAYARLNATLQRLLDNKITANEAGNAADILFSDGDSIQDKLDANAFQGPAGLSVELSGLFYLRVGADGHLYVGVADGAEQPPLSINSDGCLIYTIE